MNWLSVSPKILVCALGMALAAGTLPSARASVAFEWTDPAQVGASQYIFSPQIGLAADGTKAVVVWADSSNLRSRVGSVSSGVATWGSEITVDSGAPGNVELALSGDGSVALVAWRRNSNLAHYAVGTVSGSSITWSSPVSLNCNCLVQPAVSADGTRATLLYHDTQGNAIYSKSGVISGNSVTWSTEATLASGVGVGSPLLGLSADGTRIMAFFGTAMTGLTPVYKAVAGTVSGSPPTVTWGSVASVSNGTRSYSPQLAFSADGSTAVVAWYDIVTYPDTRVYSRTASVSGTAATWSSIEAHTGAGTADAPRVALSGTGQLAMIAWQRSVNGSDTKAVMTSLAQVSGSTATWGSPLELPGSIGSGSLYDAAMAGDGSAAVVMWASQINSAITVQASSTDLAGGLNWQAGVVLNGSLTPAGVSYPAVAITDNGGTAAALWALPATPNQLYVNTGAASSPPAPPAPAPPTPAAAPGSVVGVAGDRSATVSWSAPASSGSFPVSHYLATSTPGAHTCLVTSPALTCEVAGLSNGTAYTFTVKALTGAGWSAASEPSNAVVPRESAGPSILITGSRDGNRIEVTGSTTGFGMGGVLNPWVRLAGQSAYAQGSAQVLASMDGTFAWSRTTGKKASVYMQTPDGSVRSNTVTIRAR